MPRAVDGVSERIVRLRELVPRGATPSSVRLYGGTGSRIDVRITTTGAGFGGRRAWFVCGHCERRVGILYVGSHEAECRWCRGTRYPSQIYSQTRAWVSWGRVANRLARVRAILGRRYLRLARRGALERLAKHLEEEVCRGLGAELSTCLNWIESGHGGILMAVLPSEPAR